MFDRNAKIFTIGEEAFNRELNGLNLKFENLKADDFEYYKITTDSWVNAINLLLKDPVITENLRIRLERILELFNK